MGAEGQADQAAELVGVDHQPAGRLEGPELPARRIDGAVGRDADGALVGRDRGEVPAGAAQAQGREDLIVDEGAPRLTADAGRDQADQGHAGVGVRVARARRELGRPTERGQERRLGRPGGAGPVRRRTVADRRHAGGVGDQMAHGHAGQRARQLRQPAPNRLVEGQAPRGHQAERRGGGDQLGDRADAVARGAVGRGAAARVAGATAVTPPHAGAVVDRDHRRRRRR